MQTTVVGNYPKIPNKPRPARLRNAINKRDRGEITDAELEAVRVEVTVDVISEQIEAGIDVITDGQVRWDDDQTYVARNFKGIEIGGLQRYLDTNTYYRQPEINGAIAFGSPVLAADWKFAQSKSIKPVKAIVPGPYTLAALSLDKHYNSRAKAAVAYAEALRGEVEALVAAGCKHVQVNDRSSSSTRATTPSSPKPSRSSSAASPAPRPESTPGSATAQAFSTRCRPSPSTSSGSTSSPAPPTGTLSRRRSSRRSSASASSTAATPPGVGPRRGRGGQAHQRPLPGGAAVREPVLRAGVRAARDSIR